MDFAETFDTLGKLNESAKDDEDEDLYTEEGVDYTKLLSDLTEFRRGMLELEGTHKYLRDIEQSIKPDLPKQHGLRRVCYFYNAHALEQFIVDQKSDDILQALEHALTSHLNNDSMEQNVVCYIKDITFFDGTHDNFHGGAGNNNPDLRIVADVTEINEHGEVINEKNNQEFTCEVKIVYSGKATAARMMRKNLHNADIVICYQYSSQTVALFQHAYSQGTLFDKGTSEIYTAVPVHEIILGAEAVGILNPQDYPAEW